jgi:hypothetical protein
MTDTCLILIRCLLTSSPCPCDHPLRVLRHITNIITRRQNHLMRTKKPHVQYGYSSMTSNTVHQIWSKLMETSPPTRKFALHGSGTQGLTDLLKDKFKNSNLTGFLEALLHLRSSCTPILLLQPLESFTSP